MHETGWILGGDSCRASGFIREILYPNWSAFYHNPKALATPVGSQVAVPRFPHPFHIFSVQGLRWKARWSAWPCWCLAACLSCLARRGRGWMALGPDDAWKPEVCSEGRKLWISDQPTESATTNQWPRINDHIMRISDHLTDQPPHMRTSDHGSTTTTQPLHARH